MYLPIDRAEHPRRIEVLVKPLCEPQISYYWTPFTVGSILHDDEFPAVACTSVLQMTSSSSFFFNRHYNP
jgi:hypothetical protein